MNKTLIKYIAIGVVALAVIYGAVKLFSHQSNVGAVIYPTALTSFPNGVQVGGGTYSQGFVQSGINSTSTTATSYTLVGADFIGQAVVSITPNVNNLNMNLPASSTLTTWLPNPGDFTTLIFFNASTTAGTVMGFNAGTGSLLEVGSSTSATATGASTTASRAIEFDVFRKPNTDLVWLAQPFN